MTRKSSGERQQEIVRAVLDLIATDGIQGLTMGRIASHIGVSEAALYRHFRSKHDMMYAVIAAAFDQVAEKLVREAERKAGAIERLHRVFSAHLRFIEDNPGVARILFSEEVHFNSLELQREINARIERLLRFIGGIIAAGVENGELSPGVEIDAAAALYLGLIQTQLLLWSVSGKRGRLISGAGRVWELYKRALV